MRYKYYIAFDGTNYTNVNPLDNQLSLVTERIDRFIYDVKLEGSFSIIADNINQKILPFRIENEGTIIWEGDIIGYSSVDLNQSKFTFDSFNSSTNTAELMTVWEQKQKLSQLNVSYVDYTILLSPSIDRTGARLVKEVVQELLPNYYSFDMSAFVINDNEVFVSQTEAVQKDAVDRAYLNEEEICLKDIFDLFFHAFNFVPVIENDIVKLVKFDAAVTEYINLQTNHLRRFEQEIKEPISYINYKFGDKCGYVDNYAFNPQPLAYLGIERATSEEIDLSVWRNDVAANALNTDGLDSSGFTMMHLIFNSTDNRWETVSSDNHINGEFAMLYSLRNHATEYKHYRDIIWQGDIFNNEYELPNRKLASISQVFDFVPVKPYLVDYGEFIAITDKISTDLNSGISTFENYIFKNVTTL